MPDLSAIIPGGRLTLSPITPSLAGHSTFSAFSDVRGLNSTAAAEPSTTSALPSHFEDRPIEDVLALCAGERIFTVLLRLQTHIFSLTRRLLLCISVTHVRGKNTYFHCFHYLNFILYFKVIIFLVHIIFSKSNRLLNVDRTQCNINNCVRSFSFDY